MSRSREFRTRIYYATPTPERLFLLAVAGMASIAIIGYGIGVNMAGSSRGNGFMGLGLFLLVVAGLVFGRTDRSSVKITEGSFTFDAGTERTELPWSEVREFHADPPSRRWFRTAVIGDGTGRHLVVKSYTFRDYDQIVSLVEVAMKTHWKGAGGGGP